MGEAWPLLFTRGEGFKLDPKEERTLEELEERIAADSGSWRTVKEWAAELGIREKRAKTLLEKRVEAGQVESTIGPPGRSPKAHCYRTAPEARAKSGAVTQLPRDDSTVPTAPTSIEDVGSGRRDGSAPDTGAVNGRALIGDGRTREWIASFPEGAERDFLAEFVELFDARIVADPFCEEARLA